MLLGALLVALSCACAAALTPLSAAEDDNDCALYLAGPGRTSAYDYRLNLLKGNFGYEGQHTCITYDAVNQAYLDARKRILVSQPKGDWKAEDFASVGELILDVSINLARTYGLSYEEIEKGLPLIDTSRTLIREVCPPIFSHVECRAGKYRRLDGLCNNLENPTWGATMAPFQRLIGPLFADGINSPRISHTGRDLPLSRVVSRTMHPDDGFHDHAGTVMVIAWGQFMDHDFTLTGTPLDPRNRNDPEECCKRPPHLKHPYCNEIRVPDDDYFYRLFNVKCIDFVRAFPSPRPGCRLGSRVPFNTLTGAIDGNTVYGVTEKFARKLRTGYGGILRMNPVFKEYGLKDLLPLKLDIPDEGCTRPNKNMYCFEAGEIRVNEQLVLTVMHTLMAREHNRVAESLATVNPHWDDETLFQEARRINIAEIQHITYNEFLPILLGKDVMEKFGLVLNKEGYWEGHDPTVNPDVIDGFAAAAYRFGHSLLPTAVERWSKAHKFIASKRLSDLIRRPYDLYRAGVLDEYVMGLMNQVAQAMDDSITQEVTNHLFKKVGARFGMDLVSFNMQRGREFGLPGYMEFRKFCGLPGANSFQELFGAMPNETVRKYESIFEHPIDVDLWSGGVSERPLPGSMLGPTFACVIATQFSYSRRGDRFWYELPNQPSSFTPEQLKEVRKARLARVICDNTDIIDTVQLYPMVLPDHELNPRVPCRSGILPSIDFSKWAEAPPFAGSAKQFVTDALIQDKNDLNSCDDQLNNSTTVESNIDILVCNDTLDSNETATLNTSIKVNQENKINEINVVQNNNEENSDKVLEYVNKKSDKLNTEQKPAGHPKNSLRRKKRSAGQLIQNPANVNYETSHAGLNIQNPQTIPLVTNAKKYISGSDLEKFSIQTLHDGVTKPDTNYEQSQELKETDNHRSKELSDNSKSIENYQDVSEENTSNQSSSENDGNHQNNLSKSKQERRPHPDKLIDNEEISDEESQSSSSSSSESDDKLTHDLPSHIKPDDTKPEHREVYQELNDKRTRNENDSINDDDISGSLEKSKEISDENIDNLSEHNNIKNSEESNDRLQAITETEDNSKPLDNIQDVDLKDFSHERIHVNHKGEVVPTKDHYENYNKRSSDEESSDIIEPESDEEESPNFIKAPVNINDGEVKPVVEIKYDSEESNEENDPPQKANLDNDESLESFLNTRKVENSEESTDAVENKPAKIKINQANVKQEFERIPLDYKHDKKPTEQTPKKTHKSSSQSPSGQDGNSEEKEPQTTKHTPYDENLSIKFDDIHIDLPEINLPDLFSFTREKSEPIKTHDEDNEKDSSSEDIKQGKTEDEDEGEDGSGHDDSKSDNHANDGSRSDDDVDREINDDDDFEYGRDHNSYRHDLSPYEEQISKYKKKSNYKNDDDNEEDEDLYEKFVRERFGKKGSFEKRSEKLQQQRYIPTDSQLYDKIDKILKHTDKTKKQAEDSNDPNAGYLWTLEYGQKLV